MYEIVVPASATATGINIVLTENQLKAQSLCCGKDIYSVGSNNWQCCECTKKILLGEGTSSSIIWKTSRHSPEYQRNCVAGWLNLPVEEVEVNLQWIS